MNIYEAIEKAGYELKEYIRNGKRVDRVEMKVAGDPLANAINNILASGWYVCKPEDLLDIMIGDTKSLQKLVESLEVKNTLPEARLEYDEQVGKWQRHPRYRLLGCFFDSVEEAEEYKRTHPAHNASRCNQALHLEGRKRLNQLRKLGWYEIEQSEHNKENPRHAHVIVRYTRRGSEIQNTSANHCYLTNESVFERENVSFEDTMDILYNQAAKDNA